MIPSSLPLKTGAVLVAAAMNGALIAVVFREAPVRIEGGAEQSVASLGSSFADLSQGTTSPEEAPEPVSPDTAVPAEPVEEAEPVPDAQPAQTPPDTTAEAPEPAPQAPSETTMPEALAALPPEATSPLSAEPATPAETPEAAPAAPEAPSETVEAEEGEPGTVLRSPRPEGRTEAFETANRAPPEPQRTETRNAPAEAAPRGNAQTSARTGSATGDSAAEARRSSQGQGRASQAGNAAASNYPGQVMGQLSRIRPSVRARGTATVSFSIAGSGRLASVSVARSSGSGALDREAMRLVQRAAPFPPPPPGARTSFSINIEGR